MNLLAFIQIFEIQIFFAKIKSEDIMVYLHRVKGLRVNDPSSNDIWSNDLKSNDLG